MPQFVYEGHPEAGLSCAWTRVSGDCCVLVLGQHSKVLLSHLCTLAHVELDVTLV